MGEWLDRLTQMNQSEAALYVCGAAIVPGAVAIRIGGDCANPSGRGDLTGAGRVVATYLSMGSDRVIEPFCAPAAGTFHYYMGAKYFKELQYGGLYDYCLLAMWRRITSSMSSVKEKADTKSNRSAI
jgi:hypothetical protein